MVRGWMRGVAALMDGEGVDETLMDSGKEWHP
jgi:hypothetical protein